MAKTTKVLITTSGKDTSLGEITALMNKALIRIGDKPTIAHIIDAYPKDTNFVITLGHFGEQVRDFIELNYPRRRFNFVTVDKYHGPGSSLAYSMLAAREHLQEPFIYHASDTIVSDRVPAPSHNWVGGFEGQGSSFYTSFDVFDGAIHHIHDRGMLNPDYLHIGIVGVKDFKDFWQTKEALYKDNPSNSGLSDFHTINEMIKKGFKFAVAPFKTWHDVGNIEAMRKAKKEFASSLEVLDKPGESIFRMGSEVIKFFHDPKMVADRVARAQALKGLVPEIKSSGKHFYSYSYVKGDLYADVATPENFAHFLAWAKKNLWQPAREVSPKRFKEICYDFYYTKTLKRVDDFLKSRSIKDAEQIINGVSIPPVKKLLKKVDFDWLSRANQTHFHGDFILDNIIKTKNGYSLLDWRQDFGGLVHAGDMYYDLAKLNHNLTVNHGMVMNNLFTVNIKGNKISCDILRKQSLVDCQKTFFDFLTKEKFDIKKVKVLTALIWLNIAPLHHEPYDKFLFYFGKYNLWRALND